MGDRNGPGHQLLGTEVSLFTGKARAYLRFKQIPFDEVLSTRLVYKDVIVPRTGVRFIPVLITDDDIAIQDTTDIIDAMEQRYPEPPIYPQTPLQRLLALLFEVYGDEWLVIPAMHYRWNIAENRDFAILEFGRTSAPNAPVEEQRVIGERLSGPFAGALPYLGVSARTVDAIETSYAALLTELDTHFAEHRFLLGSRPSIGDFGLVGPLYAHLRRDPASGRLMEELAPRVVEWVERMQRPDGESGAFLPDDRIPASLVPILQRMFREQVPVLLKTVDALAAWANEPGQARTPGDEVPRALGSQSFVIEGASGQRAIIPYNIWMWQRPCDHLAGMDEASQARAQALFEWLPGALGALRRPIPWRVARHRNRLVLAA